MASSNNNALISRASAHTQKKFELIRNYIEPWAQKLMNNRACQGLVFIDCMCNSGLYHDENGEIIEGTPLRVSRVLREIAGQYRNKQVFLYFNDLDAEKTALLQTKLPKDTSNFHIEVTNKDANNLLKSIGGHLNQPNLHYFLLYDPYDATLIFNLHQRVGVFHFTTKAMELNPWLFVSHLINRILEVFFRFNHMIRSILTISRRFTNGYKLNLRITNSILNLSFEFNKCFSMLSSKGNTTNFIHMFCYDITHQPSPL